MNICLELPVVEDTFKCEDCDKDHKVWRLLAGKYTAFLVHEAEDGYQLVCLKPRTVPSDMTFDQMCDQEIDGFELPFTLHTDEQLAKAVVLLIPKLGWDTEDFGGQIVKLPDGATPPADAHFVGTVH